MQKQLALEDAYSRQKEESADLILQKTENKNNSGQCGDRTHYRLALLAPRSTRLNEKPPMLLIESFVIQ